MKDKILDSFADLNVSVNGYDAALKVSNKFKSFILVENLINV